MARRIATFLERGFPQAAVSITTDLAITLHAAVGDKEGIILVVGTGSGAYGRDAKGHTARAGGRGPWFSDEGSGFDIGRRALAAVVRAEEKRGPQTALSQKVLTWLGCNDWTRVLDWVVKNPDDVFPAFFRSLLNWVIKATLSRAKFYPPPPDPLAGLAASVIDQLHMKDREAPIAKAGGATGVASFSTPRLMRACAKSPRARELPRSR